VHEVLMANVNPTAVEFMERSVVNLGEEFTGVYFPYPEAKAFILLTFDGTKEQIAQNIAKARQVTAQSGAMDFLELDNPEYASQIWQVRGSLVKAVEAVSEQEPVDLVVPINRSAAFISFVHETEKKTGVQMVAFGHAGDGNVHLCIVRGDRDEETWQRELAGVMHTVYGKAYELGGLTSGEHGIGIAKRPYFLRHTNGTNLDVMRSIKEAIDPKRILNDHISYLK
jgi:glycolate oxidase